MKVNPTARRMLHIPPDLRGAARAICDVDPTQFPELYEWPARSQSRVPLGGGTNSSSTTTTTTQGRHHGATVSVSALERLVTEVNDGTPLTTQAFRLFQVAYAECRQHLRGVPASLIDAGTPLSAVLTLTTRIDSLCTELGVAMTETFPQLKEVHLFALTLGDLGDDNDTDRSPSRGASKEEGSSAIDSQAALQRFGGGEQLLLQSIMLSFMASILERAVSALLDYKETLLESKRNKARRAVVAAAAEVKVDHNDSHANNISISRLSQRRRAGAGRMAVVTGLQQPVLDAASGGLGGGSSRRSAGNALFPSPTPVVLCSSPRKVPGESSELDSEGEEVEESRSLIWGRRAAAADGRSGRGVRGYSPASAHLQAARATPVADTASYTGLDTSMHSVSGSTAPPPRVCDAISSVNADVQAHLAHLRWLVGLTLSGQFTSFAAEDHLEDASMRKMWATYIGSNRPACTAEAFEASGIVSLFPTWLHAPMMDVLNFKECGVVSIFTVQKLLKVWGPLLLLDRNIQDDVRSGVLCLREPAAYLEDTLATRTDAQMGDFAVALTEKPGEIRLIVLRPATTPRTVTQQQQQQQHQPQALDRSRMRVGASGTIDSYQGSLSPRHHLLTGPFPTNRRDSDSGSLVPRTGRRRSRWMSNASYYYDQQLLQGHQLQPSPAVSPGNADSYVFPQGSLEGVDLTNHNNFPSSFSASATGGSVWSQRQHQQHLQMLVPPLRAVSYRLTQETGAWTLQGLTKEEFESIAEACRAFPDIFRRARGEVWGGEEESGIAKSTNGRAATVSSFIVGQHGSFSRVPQQLEGGAANSGLHRACFRNNTRYVRTLLTRGASTVVNYAVTDPAVSRNFCWTPLLCAVNNPNSDPSDIVALLLNAGADATYSDDADCTALYYAIANGYVAAAKLLLAHKPDLGTSPETVPLLVALGAHPYLPCERDIRRLTDVVPSAAMMEVVSAHVNDYRLCALAANILIAKLNGSSGGIEADGDGDSASGSASASASEEDGAEHQPLTPPARNQHLLQRNATVLREVVLPHCQAGPNFEELHTPEEEVMLDRLFLYHQHLCMTFASETRRALAVLCARCYLLSWREWLAAPPTTSADTAEAAEVTESECVELLADSP